MSQQSSKFVLENLNHFSWTLTDTEYLSVFTPNAAKCERNADQNNSEYGHFLRNDYL